MSARRVQPPMNVDRLISLGGLILMFIGGVYALLNITATVTQKFTEVSADVKTISSKVDSAAAIGQSKVDDLAKTVDKNHQEVVTFQTQVTDGFKQLFQANRDLNDKITQERVDRLTDGKKK